MYLNKYMKSRLNKEVGKMDIRKWKDELVISNR